jgi:predicted ATPase
MDSSVTTATGPSPCTEVVVMSDVSTGGLRLNQRAPGAFVGRVRELAELRAGLAQTLDGRGRLYLLSGDPGVGKTRVAGELAAMAAQAGARTLWGRCWEGSGAPAYWPWIQLARTLVRGGDPAAVPTEVARLVEISGPAAVAETAPAPATETARFRLFDSMCGFLADAAADRPLVLLLDDLHWADRPSLLMLQFLARGLADAPVLIGGTYREAEVRDDEERREVIGSILRLARHLPVRGLDVAEAAELIRGHGATASERIIDRLHETTGGNPFFLDEIVRLLVVENRFADVEQGRIPLPHGVREVVRERLRRLDPATIEVLQVAATLGSQFQLAVMEQVLDLSREQLVEALGRAAVHGVLADTPMTPGGYGFVHGPVRQTLYEDIPVAARLQLHLRVGRALERYYGCGIDAHLAELAHHFVRAAPLAPVDAFRHAVRAGRQAVAVLAWEEAAGHFERALSVADLAEVDPRQRCEVLVEVGEAAVQIGARQRARRHLAAARLLARTIAEPELLARVELAVRVGVTAEMVRLAEEASSASMAGEAHTAAIVPGRRPRPAPRGRNRPAAAAHRPAARGPRRPADPSGAGPLGRGPADGRLPAGGCGRRPHDGARVGRTRTHLAGPGAGALGLSVVASDPSGSQLAAALGGFLLASAGLRRAGVAGLGLTTAAVVLRQRDIVACSGVIAPRDRQPL